MPLHDHRRNVKLQVENLNIVPVYNDVKVFLFYQETHVILYNLQY